MSVTGDLTRYRSKSTIGTGGMARVELAEDTILGREVALKRMSGTGDPQGMSRLRREALAGASLSHPNVVSIYDVVTTDDGHLTIVMEYIHGGTLRDALNQQGRLPIPEALRVLRGVGAGLDAIHERGIVHRDVKPSNILLGEDGSVKVADLGIAAVPDRTRITTSGSVLGSLSYMAPEQLENSPSTPAIDVYALAAVAYEMLSGKKARGETNPVTLAHAISTRPPPDLRTVWSEAPPAAADLLVRSMSRNPAQRPASAGELVSRLQQALEPEPTAPVVAPAPAAAAGAAAAGGAAAGGAAVGAAVARGRPPRERPARAGTPGPDGARPAAARPRSVPPRRPIPADDGSSDRRSRGGWLAAGLLGLVALAVVLAVVLGSAGSTPHKSTAAASTGSHRPRRAAGVVSDHSGSATASASSSTTPAAAPASASSSSSASASTPAASTPGVTSAQASGSVATPVSAVETFYGDAAAHRYSSAWALADPSFQSQLGGLQSFESGQSGDRSITFNSARVVDQSANTATVAITTTSVRDTGTQHCAGTVDAVRAGSGWQLHQISIGCH